MTIMNTELIELCQQLVRIPSVNPQDQPCTGEPYGETRIAAFVAEWFARYGLPTQRQIIKPGRENVVVRAAGRDRSRAMVLTAHLDTVDVKDMTVEPFAGELRDGRIYGRGACDDKGPLAALMIAFRDRVTAGNLPCDLILLASGGEEYDMSGASHFAQNEGSNISGVILAEPTGLEVIYAHKGVVRLELATHGRSAHSSTPLLGHNAIYAMGRLIPLVEQFGQNLLTRPPQPELGTETLALTIVSGGQQINVIPDICTARIDWRFLPGRTAEQCRDDLGDFLACQTTEPFALRILNHFDPMATDPNHPLVIALQSAARQAGGSGQAKGVAYATDATAFLHLGIPTPVFGPGSAAQAHTKDEFITLADLEQGLAAYRHALETLAL